MSISDLEYIASDEFAESLGTHSTAISLRRCLLRSERVRRLREALISGSIEEDGIRRFIATLLADFKRGEAFEHEIALAAIAVVIENRNSKLAEDYLIDLARTKVVELATCRRVAALCAREWAKLPRFEKMRSGAVRNRFSTYRSCESVARIRTIRGGAAKNAARIHGTIRTA
jgi:hypothetical protein